MAKGKAKLIRQEDGRYYVYARKYWFQKWKPLTYDEHTGKQISFKDFKEFGEVTKIECFDVITISYHKFAGLERNYKNQ